MIGDCMAGASNSVLVFRIALRSAIMVVSFLARGYTSLPLEASYITSASFTINLIHHCEFPSLSVATKDFSDVF